jgi:tetraacyldisaccharide 4'-kinase
LLKLLSRLYGVGQQLHRRHAGDPARRRQLACPVISIGNITTGGTGKTPMTRHVARQLQKRGWRPAIISRGYGGDFERRGGVVSDGSRVLATAGQAGDEAYMLAMQLPGVAVLVGHDRYQSGRRAQRQYGANILILDDGFQHYQLARSVDLVLLDAENPLGNGHLLPLGRLREPPENLKRADAIILVRRIVSPRADKQWLKPLFGNGPIFDCRRRQVQVGGNASGQPQRLFAFAGLARNQRFFSDLELSGAEVVASRSFPDHHPYELKTLESLSAAAVTAKADAIATTAKDHSRLPHDFAWPLKLLVMDVALEFDGDRFGAYLDRQLEQFLL